MSYSLSFLKPALKEWKKLPPDISLQFKKKLAQRLEQPCVPASQLSTLKDCYKIKLRASGYRLVYRVIKERVVVQVVAVGKRDKKLVYKLSKDRI